MKKALQGLVKGKGSRVQPTPPTLVRSFSGLGGSQEEIELESVYAASPDFTPKRGPLAPGVASSRSPAARRVNVAQQPGSPRAHEFTKVIGAWENDPAKTTQAINYFTYPAGPDEGGGASITGTAESNQQSVLPGSTLAPPPSPRPRPAVPRLQLGQVPAPTASPLTSPPPTLGRYHVNEAGDPWKKLPTGAKENLKKLGRGLEKLRQRQQKNQAAKKIQAAWQRYQVVKSAPVAPAPASSSASLDEFNARLPQPPMPGELGETAFKNTDVASQLPGSHLTNPKKGSKPQSALSKTGRRHRRIAPSTSDETNPVFVSRPTRPEESAAELAAAEALAVATEAAAAEAAANAVDLGVPPPPALITGPGAGWNIDALASLLQPLIAMLPKHLELPPSSSSLLPLSSAAASPASRSPQSSPRLASAGMVPSTAGVKLEPLMLALALAVEPPAPEQLPTPRQLNPQAKWTPAAMQALYDALDANLADQETPLPTPRQRRPPGAVGVAEPGTPIATPRQHALQTGNSDWTKAMLGIVRDELGEYLSQRDMPVLSVEVLEAQSGFIVEEVSLVPATPSWNIRNLEALIKGLETSQARLVDNLEERIAALFGRALATRAAATQHRSRRARGAASALSRRRRKVTFAAGVAKERETNPRSSPRLGPAAEEILFQAGPDPVNWLVVQKILQKNPLFSADDISSIERFLRLLKKIHAQRVILTATHQEATARLTQHNVQHPAMSYDSEAVERSENLLRKLEEKERSIVNSCIDGLKAWRDHYTLQIANFIKLINSIPSLSAHDRSLPKYNAPAALEEGSGPLGSYVDYLNDQFQMHAEDKQYLIGVAQTLQTRLSGQGVGNINGIFYASDLLGLEKPDVVPQVQQLQAQRMLKFYQALEAALPGFTEAQDKFNLVQTGQRPVRKNKDRSSCRKKALIVCAILSVLACLTLLIAIPIALLTQSSGGGGAGGTGSNGSGNGSGGPAGGSRTTDGRRSTSDRGSSTAIQALPPGSSVLSSGDGIPNGLSSTGSPASGSSWFGGMSSWWNGGSTAARDGSGLPPSGSSGGLWSTISSTLGSWLPGWASTGNAAAETAQLETSFQNVLSATDSMVAAVGSSEGAVGSSAAPASSGNPVASSAAMESTQGSTAPSQAINESGTSQESSTAEQQELLASSAVSLQTSVGVASTILPPLAGTSLALARSSWLQSTFSRSSNGDIGTGSSIPNLGSSAGSYLAAASTQGTVINTSNQFISSGILGGGSSSGVLPVRPITATGTSGIVAGTSGIAISTAVASTIYTEAVTTQAENVFAASTRLANYMSSGNATSEGITRFTTSVSTSLQELNQLTAQIATTAGSSAAAPIIGVLTGTAPVSTLAPIVVSTYQSLTNAALIATSARATGQGVLSLAPFGTTLAGVTSGSIFNTGGTRTGTSGPITVNTGSPTSATSWWSSFFGSTSPAGNTDVSSTGKVALYQTSQAANSLITSGRAVVAALTTDGSTSSEIEAATSFAAASSGILPAVDGSTGRGPSDTTVSISSGSPATGSTGFTPFTSGEVSTAVASTGDLRAQTTALEAGMQTTGNLMRTSGSAPVLKTTSLEVTTGLALSSASALESTGEALISLGTTGLGVFSPTTWAGSTGVGSTAVGSTGFNATGSASSGAGSSGLSISTGVAPFASSGAFTSGTTLAALSQLSSSEAAFSTGLVKLGTTLQTTGRSITAQLTGQSTGGSGRVTFSTEGQIIGRQTSAFQALQTATAQIQDLSTAAEIATTLSTAFESSAQAATFATYTIATGSDTTVGKFGTGSTGPLTGTVLGETSFNEQTSFNELSSALQTSAAAQFSTAKQRASSAGLILSTSGTSGTSGSNRSSGSSGTSGSGRSSGTSGSSGSTGSTVQLMLRATSRLGNAATSLVNQAFAATSQWLSASTTGSSCLFNLGTLLPVGSYSSTAQAAIAVLNIMDRAVACSGSAGMTTATLKGIIGQAETNEITQIVTTLGQQSGISIRSAWLLPQTQVAAVAGDIRLALARLGTSS